MDKFIPRGAKLWWQRTPLVLVACCLLQMLIKSETSLVGKVKVERVLPAPCLIPVWSSPL